MSGRLYEVTTQVIVSINADKNNTVHLHFSFMNEE